jgi:hypothetical protein
MNLTEKFANAVIASSVDVDDEFNHSYCNHGAANNKGWELTALHDESCVVLEAYKYLQIPVPVPDAEV